MPVEKAASARPGLILMPQASMNGEVKTRSGTRGYRQWPPLPARYGRLPPPREPARESGHPKATRIYPLSALIRLAEQTPFYIFTAFVFTYGTTVLGAPRDLILTAVLTASVVSLFSNPFFGHVSDRIGRKRMYLLGAAAMGLFGFLYFTLLDTAVPGWIFLAIMLSLIPHDMMYGPQAALIAESFTGRLRYSGASLGYHLASVIAGGPAPLIATALLARYHSGYAIALYILMCASVGFLSAMLLKDYTNKDISVEYDEAGPPHVPAATAE